MSSLEHRKLVFQALSRTSLTSSVKRGALLSNKQPVAYTESGNTPGDRSLGVSPAHNRVKKGVEPSSHPSRMVPAIGTLIDGGDEPRLGDEPKGIVQIMGGLLKATENRNGSAD